MIDKKSASIQDVARVAGVSISTVSRVLNDRPDVADTTRHRIQQVIDELGYEPYVRATDRHSPRLLTIAAHYPLERYAGVDIPQSMAHEVHSLHFFGGMGQAAREMGYALNIITTSITSDELLNFYRQQHVDGLIVLEIAQFDWRVNLLREHNLPFVMIGQCANNAGLDLIDIDHDAHTRRAFEYLVEMGHCRIALLGYPRDALDQGFTPAVQVRKAYTALCHQYGLPVMYQASGFTPSVAQEAAQALLAAYPQVTAIITAFAAATPGALRALQGAGRHIPRDCSVVSILAPRREAELMIPSLTVLDFPMYEMGYRAVEMLAERLRGGIDRANQTLIEADFIIGESSGPVR